MTQPVLKRISTDGPVISCFLPGTRIQFAWDSTSLGYIKTCPKLYWYIMIEGWEGKDENIHLYFGNEYHKSLEEFDKFKAAGQSHDEAVRSALRALMTRTFGWTVDEDIKPGKFKNRRSLIRTFLWYVDKYRDDPATTVILKDGSPAVELSFRFELSFGPQGKAQPYLLCGHLDRVVYYMDDMYVNDHKTTTTTPGPYYFDGFGPNNQMSLYTFASQVVLHSPIKGVMISAAQLLTNDSRYVRGFTQRTPAQIEEWVNDLQYWFTLAEQYAKVGHWPMNDTACDKFGGCKFRGICSKDPRVREQYLKAHFVKKPLEDRWNPLKPR